MTFSFVIPTYNKYELLHQCLFDIYKKCSPVLEVIVADNGSTEEKYQEGLAWWSKVLPIRHLRIDENVGFLKASNIGMKKAKGDIVCLLSNDVRIYQDIVKSITKVLDEVPKSLVGGRLLDWGTGWNEFREKTCPYVEGWLLATLSENWKELNYFDPIYAPYDYEDVDLSTTAISLGYDLIAIPEQETHHIGAQSISYGSEREQQTMKNREKFSKKWNLSHE